jgi:hypothetical protein
MRAIMFGTPAFDCSTAGFQVKRGQRLRDVHLRDLRRRFALNRGQDQRDDALGDGGVGVGQEIQTAIARHGVDPHAGRAAAHQRGVGFERIGHGGRARPSSISRR